MNTDSTNESDLSFGDVFVGRSDEMARLLSGLERSFQTRQSSVVVGEAGMGKSRLLSEFAKETKQRYPNLFFVNYVFSPKETIQNSLFKSLIDQCLTATNTNFDQGRSFLLEQIGATHPIMRDAFHDLVESDLPPSEAWKSLDVATKKSFSASVILRFINYLSTVKPVALVLEDAHLADSEFLLLLRNLMAKLTKSRVFLVLSMRPTRKDEVIGAMENSDIVTLAPLSLAAQTDLLDRWLGTSPTLKPIKMEVTAISEGNPLFLQEIVSMILREGKLSGALGNLLSIEKNTGFVTPPTLKLLMERRIQSLLPHERFYAGYAAVIGDRFNTALLAELTGSEIVAVDKALEQLARQNVVQRDEKVSPESWRFCHSLIRDAAYSLYEPAQRQRLHTAMLQALENSPRSARDIALCAHHSFKAGSYEKAFIYNYLAGNAALNAAEGAGAIAFFENAIYSLEKSPPHKNTGRYLVKSKIGLATGLSISSQHFEARSVIRDAEYLLRDLENSPSGLGNKIKLLALFDLWIQGNLDRGVDIGKSVLESFDIENDAYSYVTVAIRLAGMLQDKGRYDESNQVLSKIQSRFNKTNAAQRYGLLFSASILCHAMMARNYGEIGDFSLARKHAAATITFVRQNKNPLAVIYGLSYASTYLIREERFDLALSYFAKAFETCAFLKTNLLYPFVAAHFGYVLFRTGNAQGLTLMEEACAIAKKQNAHGREGLYLQLLAEARLLNKDYQEALKLSAEAIATGEQYCESANVARAYYISGQACLGQEGRGANGITLIRKARNISQDMKLQSLIDACDSLLLDINAA